MKHIRICSVLLALILAFSSLPLSVIAENTISFHDKNQVILDQNFTTETTDESDNVFIVQEDTTKRGEFEKHYICSNGTYVVASYAEAIHYKDDNGEWADVDNRPVQTAKGDYTTRNGDFGISVPSSTGDGHLMRMDKGEHSLSWTLSANKKAGTIKMDSNVSAMAQRPIQSQKMQVGATKRPEIIVSNTEQPLENHKILRDEATFELPNVSGKVRYDDLFGADEGVSVVYTTYRNKIEEDIYIEKPTDITSFSMEVAAPDLTPRLNADNSVDFLDNDGKMCYHVGIPYMMDADFAVLNDIETTVIRSGDIWVITYTPDAEWFTSEERVYPILLDPSITTNEYRTNMQDTYVEEGDNTVHSSEQLLYINGGTGNRKAVIRFLTLPAIDDTMPLISASLTLYSQYSPFSDVFLKLAYSRDNVSTSISSYTYAAAANATSLYTSYGTLVTGSTSVTFNLTNCMYEMYESGRDDLILGYSSESDTTFCYPFHSVDTTTDYKPTLKVVYGYSIPETENSKLGNGKIIALKNVGTGAYMTANESLGSNVYQQNVDEITNNQRFRMKYMSDTGGYRLYAMGSSSGKIVGIQPTNGIVYGTKNVSLYTPDNPNTQEWLIIPVSANQFRIVSRTDTSKCLTAYPGNAGSATTTAASTSGNVYATTVSEGNNNQIWCLTDQNNVDIFLDLLSSDIDNGEYYIINNYTGRYLYKHSIMQSIRGTMESIGENNVTFKITNLQNGYCTIQTQNGYFLYAYSDDPGSSIRMSSMDDSIPDAYQWQVDHQGGGKYTIQNKLGGYFLSDTGDLYCADQPNMYLNVFNTEDEETYQRLCWRLISTNHYNELKDFDVGDAYRYIYMHRGETSAPDITVEPADASFSTTESFYYTILLGTSLLSADSLTGNLTAINHGIATISIVHKTTGKSHEVHVKIFDYPELFQTFHDASYVETNDVTYTHDGCYIIKKSLADILNQAGIHALYEKEPYTSEHSISVMNYFDDWYIYAIIDENAHVYSLYKMREQEYERDPDGDGQAQYAGMYDADDPGVTISFISFNTAILTACIDNPSNENKYNLYQELDKVIVSKKAEHDDTIVQYYDDIGSCGAYIIGEAYIQFIASLSENHQINAPEKLKKLLSTSSSWTDTEIDIRDRVSNLISTYNSELGSLLYDMSEHKINITNINSLTEYEKNMILVSFTANASLDSFAAEVRAHALSLSDPSAFFLENRFERADMTITSSDNKEHVYYTDYFPYHDPNSNFLKYQINAHTNCLHNQ